jgi:hypothetical protein
LSDKYLWIIWQSLDIGCQKLGIVYMGEELAIAPALLTSFTTTAEAEHKIQSGKAIIEPMGVPD